MKKRSPSIDENGRGRLPPSVRVLVAEDNPVDRLLVASLLRSAGLEPEAVDSGKAAVKATAEKRYDLVLMDVQMPEMDGVEATRRIRSREEGTSVRLPIIALTAHRSIDNLNRFLDAGMDGHLGKPIDVDELFVLLRKYAPSDDDPPFVDLKDLHERFEGDKALVRDVLEVFVLEHENAIRMLKEACNGGDSAALADAAHGFMGTAVNVSAKVVHGLCVRLEKAASAGDTAVAGELVLRLENAVRQTAEMAKAILREME